MKTNTLRFVFLLFVTVLCAQSALALPLGHPRDRIPPYYSFNPSRSVDFSAIVALNNCSGSLVRYTTSLGTDQAMILTNGHCYEGGFIKPGKVIVNAASSRSFRLLSSDGKQSLGTLTANRVIYATMTNTDMTLYGLTESFDQIERKYRVTPLTLSPAFPKAGRPIAIASGYWRRIYTCNIDRFIYALREDQWMWRDSIRYSTPGCETIGGTSGSPIIDAETREVVGVNNTGNEDGETCTMNNPCEVDPNGKVTTVYKASYGQQTFWVYSCLEANNQINLAKPGCMLTKPAAWYRR